MLSTIEKRVKKDIRLNNPFKKNERVLAVTDGTKEAFLTIYLVERITNGLDLKISTAKDGQHPDMYDKIILPINGDDIAENFMETLKNQRFLASQKSKKISVKLNKNPQKENNSKIISLLKTVLDKEVSECVKRLGRDCKIEKRLLDCIESKYPGSKFGFLKSVSFLEGLE